MIRKELVERIMRNSEKIEKMSDFSEYYNDDNFQKITAEDWIKNFKIDQKFITIDARSGSEFAKDHLPNSINFAVLNDKERDEVGFLYKHFSDKAALFRANEFADAKMDKIESFTKKIIKSNKPIYVYCWRGGKRSSALISLMQKFGAKPIKIIGGYKAYRNKIYNLFYEDASMLKLMPLIGLTGCGKTLIIENLTGKVPTFDIEKSATHASSLFGKIRYDLKNTKNITTQIQFEHDLYKQLISPIGNSQMPFLTEGESKRINTFNIPDALYAHLVKSPAIKIIAPMEKRVERIRKEYFGGNGYQQVYDIVASSNFLHKTLGEKTQNMLLQLIADKRYDEFSEWFLLEYYDKRYATNYKNIIAEVNSSDISEAEKEILSIMQKNIN